MKVAYLINQYPKISHTFVRREIAALERAGLEIERFSFRRTREELPDPDDRAELSRTHVILESPPSTWLESAARCARDAPSLVGALGLTASSAAVSEQPARHAAYFGEATQLVRMCDKLGVDHVHAHFGTNSATVAMLCNALGGPPYSFTVHGPEEFDRPREIHLAEKIARANFVVAISAFGRSQLWRRTPFDQWGKIHVVRCGVDDALLRSSTTAPTGLRFVCIGRLCEQKGQMVAVEAMPTVLADAPEAELVFVGDGELRADLEARATELGVASHVHFHGWATGAEVRALLEGARGMVLPSFAEGLPVVIMESLALARPVVTTYIAGIPELVRPGESGWLVPAGDPTELAQAMVEMARTPSPELERMGKSGRERVRMRHSVDVEAKKLAALFRA